MSLAPGAEMITLTNRPADVASCKAVGYIRAPDSVEDIDVPTMLRNQALGLGGDVVLLTDGFQNGLAYSCKGIVPARSGAAPVMVPAAPTPANPGPMGTVTFAKAERGDIDTRFVALGTVTPLSTVTVKAQVSGQLQQVAFSEGQLVHEGDVLAQIDPSSAQAALDQAQGILKRDQALLAGARLELKRATAQQAELPTITVEQDMGTVEADEAAVAAAQLNLGRTRIVAPVSGRAGLRQVDRGSYVSPSDAHGIVVITVLQPISALFVLPEGDISQLSQRLAAGATLPVRAFRRDCDASCMSSAQNELAEGRLLGLENSIGAQTGTVRLRAAFDNKDGALFPQQAIKVEVLEDTQNNQVLIPRAAVNRGPAGNFVYLVNTKTRKVSVRAVHLGVADAQRVAVMDGLAAGDVVVTGGAQRLYDGATVTLHGLPGGS